jgi:hypothetical protein
VSADLYADRLFWNGRAGVVKSDGVAVDLRECPLAKPIAEIDFAPMVRAYQIREFAGGWREMYPPEIKACAELLKRVAAAARAALD